MLGARSEIYFGKLLGRTDIEDALKTLESLIQEVIRMATTPVTKTTGAHPHRLVTHVTTILCPFRCQGSQFCYSERYKLFVICYFYRLRCEHSNSVSGKLPDVRKWFSPPDPSTNHNTACEVYHNVPSMWFFGDGIFNDWMSNGSLLWIHGKCMFVSYLASQFLTALSV